MIGEEGQPHGLTAVGFLWRMQAVEPHLTMHHSESREPLPRSRLSYFSPSKFFQGMLESPLLLLPAGVA